MFFQNLFQNKSQSIFLPIFINSPTNSKFIPKVELRKQTTATMIQIMKHIYEEGKITPQWIADHLDLTAHGTTGLTLNFNEAIIKFGKYNLKLLQWCSGLYLLNSIPKHIQSSLYGSNLNLYRSLVLSIFQVY